jgi:hypothetical protein
MSDLVTIEELERLLITLNGQPVLVDADVAKIYGVSTRDVNKAVANNPEKFPHGYVIELTREDKLELVENFHRFKKLKHSSVNPKAFPERGLYMLATILKSPQAVRATISIVETFARMRELTRNIKTMAQTTDKSLKQNLMQKSANLISGILDDDLQTTDTETTIEINFAVLKMRHLIKKRK